MESCPIVLIADDEPNIRRVLEAMFVRHGFAVLTAENGKKAIALAKAHPLDLLISDLIMPDINGVDLLRAVKDIHPGVAAILITAYGTIKTAVEAMRLGAYNYIAKPFEMDDVLEMAKRAIDARPKPDELPPPITPTRKSAATFKEIIGSSPAMTELFRIVERAADSRATILIRGESGTGKELIARAVHQNSGRAAKPFVAVSCAALPETLLESELFGHEKNAFTGAASQKPGRFEMADTGTLFLDEIGEIPHGLQVKLLRVLQERSFERLGGTKSLKVDVRLLAATNRDLEKAVADREFRDDLYYRLQVIQVMVPPLRERAEDIAPIAAHFVKRFAKENDRKVKGMSPDMLELLKSYPFPGNVRELENAIERAVVLADRDATLISPDLLPGNILRFKKN